MIYLIFNKDGVLLQSPIAQSPMPVFEVIANYVERAHGSEAIIHETDNETLNELIMPVTAAIANNKVLKMFSAEPEEVEEPEETDPYAHTFIESAGDFIGRLPLVVQRDFDRIVLAGNEQLRILDRYIKGGGIVNTATAKTQGSVYYLTGAQLNDDRGEPIPPLETPILSITQARKWLSGQPVTVDDDIVDYLAPQIVSEVVNEVPDDEIIEDPPAAL